LFIAGIQFSSSETKHQDIQFGTGGESKGKIGRGNGISSGERGLYVVSIITSVREEALRHRCKR